MGNTHHLIRFLDGKRHDIVIAEGELYEVLPEDPANTAQRGRICRVEGFDDFLMPTRARVRFEDTGRIGLIEIGELAALRDAEEPSVA